MVKIQIQIVPQRILLPGLAVVLSTDLTVPFILLIPRGVPLQNLFHWN